MTSSITDRIYGESSTVAIKAPCVAVALSAIALSGLGAVGGYTPNPGDRILVTAQADPTTNGIYNAATGAWQRAGDFSSTNQVVQGTLVVVLFPNMQGLIYQLVTNDPAIGSSQLIFQTFANLNPNVFIAPTPGEIMAGATIVQPTLYPGNPERYFINASPGTTPAAAAFNMAYQSVSLNGGGEMQIGIGPFHMEAPVNCTFAGAGNCPPVEVRWLASTHNADPPQGCVLNHNSIGFDCTGNDTIQFEKPTITTPVIGGPPANIPTIGILLARNTHGVSLVNRVNAPKIVGFFSVANIYDYGSEGLGFNTAYLNNWGTAGAGNCCLAFTANNYAGVQSIVSGLIWTGSVSMTVVENNNGQYYMLDPSSTSDCVHIEGAQLVGFRDGFGFNAGGRSIFYIDNSHATATGFNTIDGCRVDAAGAPQDMILFGASASVVAHIGWNIRGLRSNTMTGGYAISCADANTTIYGFTIDPISEQQSNGINIPGSLDGFSQLRLGATVVNIGKVTTGCVIIGDPANITIGAGFNQARIIANNAPQAPGFGTPTGAGLIANFPGSAASASQCGEVLSYLLDLLKTSGDLAA